MSNRRRLRIRPTWVWPTLLSAIVIVLVTAGASAAIETNTVRSYWRGLWWSISLITTVGFVGEPPETRTGAALSAVMMVVGFLLLAMVSASMAALFVREEEQPREQREDASDRAVLAALDDLARRLAAVEQHLAQGRRLDDPGAQAPPGSSGDAESARPAE